MMRKLTVFITTGAVVVCLASPVRAVGSARCETNQLRVRWVDGEGAAGTIYNRFRAVNASSTPCHMRGHFKVRLLDRMQRGLETHEDRVGSSPRAAARQPKRVELLPGDHAWWDLSYSDVCAAKKAVRASNVRVWAPHSDQPQVLPVHPRGDSGTFYACNGDINVYRVYSKKA
jgi:hypothetical protein